MLDRNFCFTWNNPPDDALEILKKLKYKYCVIGYETAPTTGTKHLQGFITFENKKVLTALRRKMTGCHVEVKSKNSTFKQAIDYCKKEGHYDEHGTPPLDPSQKGSREKERWAAAVRLAKAGDLSTLCEEYPQLYVSQLYKWEKISVDNDADRVKTMDYDEAETPHRWFYGDPRTGKSKKAREDYPNIYVKNANKWWCGYPLSSPPTLIDDLGRDNHLENYLKLWADRYPFRGEKKGGSAMIRPPAIIVTSNYSIEELFDDPQTVGALKARFKQIHFKKLK